MQAKYNYAYMQHQLGNIKIAIQYYTEVAELNKTQWKSRQNLAIIYLLQSDITPEPQFIDRYISEKI